MKRWLPLVLLLGCGGPPPAQELFIYIWADYLAPETIPRFEKEYGVRVTVANFASGQEMRAKVMGGGTRFDVIFPSDSDLPLLQAAGTLETLDASRLPNLKN